MNKWTERMQNAIPRYATSPTVSTESVLGTETCDAHEGHNIGICNIPGECLSAYIVEDIKMALRGRLSKLMVKITPQIYRQHGIYERGSQVLYITLEKAIYGCLIPALVLYKRLVTDMRDRRFGINPYDPCVANKMIGRKQCQSDGMWTT